MIAKLLPVLIALAGLGAGAGAGYMLRPPPGDGAGEAEPAGAAPDCAPGTTAAAQVPDPGADGDRDYVELTNQFVVPVIEEGRVESLVVLSITLEMAAGPSDPVYEREPKLRDAFLQVFFDHANAGGFAGTFTRSTRLTTLRRALLEVAQKTIGPVVSDVLITDIVRQDA
jgi:hypothetical protein